MNEDPFDSEEWKEFSRSAMEDLLPKLQASKMTIQLVPDGPPDIKFALELGMSIMLDKPIVAIVLPGVQVPEHLIRVADRIVEGDMDDPSFSRRIAEALADVGGIPRDGSE